MRLWSRQLLPYLPRQQLLSQWRECCCIARNIAVNGTPNHLLVNKIVEYPDEHFDCYALLVYGEMLSRGYECDYTKFWKYRKSDPLEVKMAANDCFPYWHDEHYLRVCMANLYEKFDCCGISVQEFGRLLEGYFVITGEEYSI